MQWSFENRVKLNGEKCKELRISFAKNKPQLAPIVVNNQELECVESAKLLGVTISNNNDLGCSCIINILPHIATLRNVFFDKIGLAKSVGFRFYSAIDEVRAELVRDISRSLRFL